MPILNISPESYQKHSLIGKRINITPGQAIQNLINEVYNFLLENGDVNVNIAVLSTIFLEIKQEINAFLEKTGCYTPDIDKLLHTNAKYRGTPESLSKIINYHIEQLVSRNYYLLKKNHVPLKLAVKLIKQMFKN